MSRGPRRKLRPRLRRAKATSRSAAEPGAAPLTASGAAAGQAAGHGAPGADDARGDAGQEMGLSNSTLHWLEDGESGRPARLTSPAPCPATTRGPCRGAKAGRDGRGRRRDPGAHRIAGFLYTQAAKRQAEEQPPAAAVVEPARDLTGRAPRPRWPRTRSTRPWTWPTWRWSPTRASPTPTSSSATCMLARNQHDRCARRVPEVPGFGPAGNPRRRRRATRWRNCRRDRAARPAARRSPWRTSAPATSSRPAAARPAGGRAGAPTRAPGRRRSWTAVARRRRDNRSEGQRLRTHAPLRERAVGHRRRARRRGGRGGDEPAGGPGRRSRGDLRRAARASPRSTTPSGSTPEQRDRLAPIIRQQRSPGPSRSPRSRRSIASTSTGPGCWRCAAPSRPWPRRRSTSSSTAGASRRRPAAAAHRRRRRQEPVDRRGVDPGQDGARRAHGGAGRAISRLRLRQAQGLPRARPLPRPRSAGRLSDPPPLVRARAQGPGPTAAAAVADVRPPSTMR